MQITKGQLILTKEKWLHNAQVIGFISVYNNSFIKRHEKRNTQTQVNINSALFYINTTVNQKVKSFNSIIFFLNLFLKVYQ